MTTASDFIRATRLDAIKRNGYTYQWLGDDTYNIISHGVTVFNGDLNAVFERYATLRGNWHYELIISPSGRELKDFPIIETRDNLQDLKHVTKGFLNAYTRAWWTYKKWENLSYITRDTFLRLGNRITLGILTNDKGIDLVVTLVLVFD